MTAAELELRRTIFTAFAATGEPPPVEDSPELRALVDAHVVVLREDGQIRMAHPFAGHREGAAVRSGGRAWWGNCAWDALGIVAALGLREASVESGGVRLDVRGGRVVDDAVFHVLVPARDWWADIGFT